MKINEIRTVCVPEEHKIKVICNVTWQKGEKILEHTIESKYYEELKEINPEFIIASCLPTAMLFNEDIDCSNYPLDSVFLSNIHYLQDRWIAYPNVSTSAQCYAFIHRGKSVLHKINVVSTPKNNLFPTYKTRIGATFSGGVDSLYTLLSLDNLTDIINIPTMNDPVNGVAVSLVKKLRPELRIHRAYISDFNHYNNWLPFFHDAFLASAPLLFSNYITQVQISGTPKCLGMDMGSSADSDYLWSSAYMRFSYYGMQTRLEKVRYLASHAQNQIVFSGMQICSDAKKRKPGQTNCGHCWKCLITMLCFDCLGFRNKVTAFSYKNFENNIIKYLPKNLDVKFEFPAIIDEYKKRKQHDIIEILNKKLI